MIAHAPAKLNAFLKITGKRNNYHTLFSRFIKLPELFDTIEFIPKQANRVFSLEGNFNCTATSNTIYKMYEAYQSEFHSSMLDDFFTHHAVKVQKNIPSFAGLGGGSSDAATFLQMIVQIDNRELNEETKTRLALSVGADVPFFLHPSRSANVEGIGEIITPFEEELPSFELVTPGIECETVAVFKAYAKHFYKPLNDVSSYAIMTTHEAMEHLSIEEANDLYNPAQLLYPELKEYAKDGYFFSGSGSTFFKVKTNG